MAYKRISPEPIIEGGTNATAFTNTFGTVYYDGTKLNNIATGTTGQVLTSNGGGGTPPSFQNAPSGVGSNFPMADWAEETYQNTGFGVFAPLAAGEGTTTSVGLVAPMNCTLSNLFVFINSVTTPGTITLTVWVNGIATAMTVTFAGTGTFSDTTHTAAVTAGQIIQYRISATAAQLTGSTSIQVTI